MFSLITRPTSQLSAHRDSFTLADALFNDWLGARTAPALATRARVEVSERDNAYELRAELPGAKRDNITIDVDGNWVSISAKSDAQAERKDGSRVLYTERSSESFSRAFELPQPVDAAEANAKFEDGVLTLTLPKKSAPRSTRVAIN